jgi:sugar phosphate isomerase/epimerase
MKLGFSTLGCPEWTFDEIIEYGSRYGFEGVSFRGVHGEMDLRKIPEFAPARRGETLRRMRDAGLEPTIMMASARFALADPAEREKHLEEAKAAIDLAAAMESPAIRVFGGAIPDGVKQEDAYGWVVENLRALGDYGASGKIYTLLEVHDAFSDTYIVRDTMKRVDHPFVGVLWDTHHPYRAMGQSMREAWDNVGQWTRDTHFKDSVVDPNARLGYRYTLLGEGEVPVIEALRLLKDAGYEKYLTLEWEKAWHPDIPDAHVCFPRYVETMRRMLADLTTP